jgi:hypothetical protein
MFGKIVVPAFNGSPRTIFPAIIALPVVTVRAVVLFIKPLKVVGIQSGSLSAKSRGFCGHGGE